MPSLRQLLAAHSPLLLIDAASRNVQTGWLTGDAAQWQSAQDEAGVAIFRCVEQLGHEVGSARALIYCDGPGSILGVRTSAMAIRAWNVLQPKPTFGFSSLAVVAHALGRPEVSVIADARRDSWHQYRIGAGLRRVGTAELTGELVTPDGFQNWTPLPSGVTRVPYSLVDLLPKIPDADLFAATDAPDAFLHEEPSYVTWTPQIHRAPER